MPPAPPFSPRRAQAPEADQQAVTATLHAQPYLQSLRRLRKEQPAALSALLFRLSHLQRLGFSNTRTYSAATPNARDQHSDAVLSELESQNDEQVKGMIGKMRLKNLSIQVGDEIRDSSALVEKEGFEGTSKNRICTALHGACQLGHFYLSSVSGSLCNQGYMRSAKMILVCRQGCHWDALASIQAGSN